ncbi:P-loop NTPase fold protein [Lactococcus lactis]|uniref:P-loop NTPase fold protein n=1 Tax=Lactococcus lactis TaxID=1358 RepID=A0AAW8UGR7_9LACT|nr:P-loop NTPase fold protein [Lactococcus lactis]MDT2947155.1 P-loop NTPase fold protein [Lactococcus lactis]
MIRIDLEKINNSMVPQEYLKESPESYEKLKNHVLHFEESSILISGYRGVGKTTMIQMLEDTITSKNNVRGDGTEKNSPKKSRPEEKTVLCIHMNMDRYDTYPNFIRNLSRELFISYKKTNKGTSADDSELLSQLEKLYQQTFYQVNETISIEKTVEKGVTNSLVLNARNFFEKIFPLLIVIFGSLLSPSKFKIPGIVVAIIGIFWFVLGNFTLSSKQSKKNIKKNNVQIESFYDSEIAEYRFFDMLNKLKEHNFKVVLIFDEIDKIDKEEKLDKTLAEIKKVILHQGTNSILIAGQRLLYKLISAGVTDDGLLSSMFSSTLHVPMLEYDGLKEKLYKYFIVNELKNDKELETLKYYIDSVILKSNSVLRQARHEIISDIEFGKDGAYIDLSVKNNSEIKLDSSLLLKVNEILTMNPFFKKREGKEDLLKYHLFIWINRMKQYKNTNFSSLEIYDRKKLDEENYPRISLNEMDIIFPTLVKSLLGGKIIEKVSTEDADFEDKEQIQYRWVKNNISSSENRDVVDEGTSELYTQLYTQAREELEFYSNFEDTYLDLYYSERPDNKINFLKYFKEEIYDNKELSENDLKDIQSLLRNSRVEKSAFLEFYTEFVLTRTLEDHGFHKNIFDKYENLNLIPDAIYSRNDKDILVEVKSYSKPQLNNSVMKQIYLYLNHWEKLLKSDGGYMKDFVAVLVIYDISTKNINKEEDYSSLQYKWTERFNNFFPEYKNRFFVILMPMISDRLLEKRIVDIVEGNAFYY